MPGSRTVPVLFAAAAIGGGAARGAWADGMVVVGGSPHGIGRASADEVGDDGGGALLVDPAALARRDVARAQIGIGSLDDDITWRPDAATAPLAKGQLGSVTLPTIAVQVPVGDWILGAAAMTAAVSDRSLTRPQIPPASFGSQFQFRYAGLGGGVRRDTVTVGAARRLGDEIAVGIAVGASRVRVEETRDVWAGFAGIHPPGDPRDDLTIALSGADSFVPSAVGGMILAPEDTSLELAISVGWSGRAHLTGDVATSEVAGGPQGMVTAPTARLDLAQPWTIRTGARYAGERWIAEVDGDLWVFPSLAYDNTWTVTGLAVTSGARTSPIPQVASRLAPRTHGAVRGALDLAVIPGFLWLTGGYAYTTRGTSEARLSPTFSDLGGHTAALGLEANAGNFTITLGASHTWSTALHPTASAYNLDNPFHAGDGSVPVGTYDGTLSQVGILLDAELK